MARRKRGGWGRGERGRHRKINGRRRRRWQRKFSRWKTWSISLFIPITTVKATTTAREQQQKRHRNTSNNNNNNSKNESNTVNSSDNIDEEQLRLTSKCRSNCERSWRTAKDGDEIWKVALIKAAQHEVPQRQLKHRHHIIRVYCSSYYPEKVLVLGMCPAFNFTNNKIKHQK